MTAVMLTPDAPPPLDYYQNNCITLINFVLDRYTAVLAPEVTRQLRDYLALTIDSQRLFARLLTRKGPLVRVDSLNYREVSDLSAALLELEQTQFVIRQPRGPGDRLLALLRKAEISEVFSRVQTGKRKKLEQVEWLCGAYSDLQIYDRVKADVDWLQVNDHYSWWLVRLVYFGDRVQDWSAFVIRDLGLMRFESIPMQRQRFASALDLDIDLAYRRWSYLSRRLDEHPGLAGELVGFLLPSVDDRFAKARRDRALLRIGQWCERQLLTHTAIAAYGAVARHPARERIVRLFHKQGDSANANRWLEEIRRQPMCEQEQQFAERFGKRKAGFQPKTTIIDIPLAEKNVEQQALSLILQPMQWGLHSENSLIRTLTGLLYWSVIYADIAGAFTNPFQSAPNDLYADDFFEARQEQIVDLERRVKNDETLRRHLQDTLSQKRGISSSLVNWNLFTEHSLDDFLNALPFDDIRALCGFLIRHLSTRSTGFPDLFVVRGYKKYEFVEVKGPNDQLQPGQRIWFKHLSRLGIPARVVKLKLKGS